MVRLKVRLVRDRRRKAVEITGPQDVYDLLRREARHCDRERFWAISVDARNMVIGCELVSVGSMTASIVHPREVWKAALVVNAAGIVVAHCHPSGDPRPSPEDRATTQRLKRAGEILGVPLLDHLILANGTGRFFSFRGEGLL